MRRRRRRRDVASISTTPGVAAFAIWPTLSAEVGDVGARRMQRATVVVVWVELCDSDRARAAPPGDAATATTAAIRFVYLGMRVPSSWSVVCLQ